MLAWPILTCHIQLVCWILWREFMWTWCCFMLCMCVCLCAQFEGDYKIWQFPVWSSVTLEINIKHTCTVTKQTINTSTAHARAPRTHPSALITTKHKHLAMRNVLLTNKTKNKRTHWNMETHTHRVLEKPCFILNVSFFVVFFVGSFIPHRKKFTHIYGCSVKFGWTINNTEKTERKNRRKE